MSAIRVDPFADVLAAFQRGEAVVLADDVARENEGDLVVATELLTPEAVAFMMHEARGLICVSISTEIAERLALPLQVLNNNSPYNTPFTLSVDYRAVGANGVSASARCATMRRLVSAEAGPEDFTVPGHVFPLIAHPSGVIGRQGQTEGSHDLARICGLSPSGVICEILSPDGTMARGSALNAFAERHRLKVTTIEEILRYRRQHEVLVRQQAEAPLETDFGTFAVTVFEDEVEQKEHLLLRYGPLERLTDDAPLIRVHSECLTGDVFGSRRCDCGPQLANAMREIVAAGSGAILYLRQEGRGIGLLNKLRAYELQDEGHDTVEANVQLGFEADQRDFIVAAKMLLHVGIRTIRLITNNPRKIQAMESAGIEVRERIALPSAADEYCRVYLQTKRDKLGHLLDL